MTVNHRSTTQPRRIAIIGAGISGIATAAHILQYNANLEQDLFDVTVFERSNFIGGVWQYDERQSPEPAYPQNKPPNANSPDHQSSDEDYATTALKHAPPGPAYLGLKNNVPTSLMHSTLQAWPEGTEEYVRHEHIVRYIRQLAESTGAIDSVVLNTSVEHIWKDKSSSDSRSGVYGGAWHVRTRTLQSQPTDAPKSAKPVVTSNEHEFDSVIVASGHYHVPRVPPIPGLQAWKETLPSSITHAKSYRKPEGFENKRVLIIGSSASAHDISKEIGQVASTVYVSSRGGQWDIAAPEPAVRVGEVEEFIPINRTIRLKNDSVLTEIDHVIIATGYLTSYPFLGPRLQDPSISAADADNEIVVTQDGLLTHNLHKDVWYIPDPSLAFVGVVFHTSTFSLFDFQGQVVARVLAGLTELPSREAMRAEYVARKERICGKPSVDDDGTANSTLHLRGFHSLMGRETEYMDEILAWVNEDASRLGVPEMKRLGEKWHARYEEIREQIKARRLSAKGAIPTGGVVFGPLGRVEKEESEAALASSTQLPKDVQGVTDRVLQESEEDSDGGAEYVLSDGNQQHLKRKQGNEFNIGHDEDAPRKLLSGSLLSTERVY